MNNKVQKTTLIEYRYSKSFWIKKILLLAGCVMLVWFGWWLWKWEPNPVVEDNKSIIDTDLDGINDRVDVDDDDDGFSDVSEMAAGSDPLDENSTPENVTDESAEESEQGTTEEVVLPFAITLPDGYQGPDVSEDCLYIYTLTDQATSGTTTVSIDTGCASNVSENVRDWQWGHSSGADATVLTANSTIDCNVATDSLCSTDDSQLEITSVDESINGLNIYITDTTGVNLSNATATFQPIIESLKVAQ